jgi:hypothetical protein
MTVGELKAAMNDENLCDNDKILIASQDGSVWSDFSIHQESLNGETVGLVELIGDGDDSLANEESDDYDFVMSGLEGMEDDDFDE